MFARLIAGMFVVALAGSQVQARDADSMNRAQASSVVRSGSRLVLRNSLVRRALERENEVWRTRSFARADGSDEVQVESDEFLVLLMDGTELKMDDYRAQGDPVTKSSDKSSIVEIAYAPRGEPKPGAPRSILVRYSLGEEPYLRKSLTLTMAAGEAVDRLEVERFKTGFRCDLGSKGEPVSPADPMRLPMAGDPGGKGQPVFIGNSWFAGLEYPGSYADYNNDGLVTLAHYPGLAKKSKEKGYSWVIQSKSVVIGTGLKDDPLELVFSDYLDTVRLPCPKYLVYCTGFVGSGDDNAKQDVLMANFTAVKDKLDAYGVKMDCFMPDQVEIPNRQSIQQWRKDLYPEGPTPLRRAIEATGSRLGLWFPLIGCGLDTLWGRQNGYEVSPVDLLSTWKNPMFPGYYCASGPKFNAELRKNLRQLITEANISYFKHDFIMLHCWVEGHGHLPTARHGFEANLDATLDLMAYERQVQSNILMAPTSMVWQSPWWLMHANYLWCGAMDYGAVKTWPQLSPEEWAMNYHDYNFFLGAKQRHLVPISATIIHAICHAKDYSSGGGTEEPAREWSDGVMMVYGRGLRLVDLYITPSMMNPDQWRTLGVSLRWWQENSDVLAKSVTIGGDLRKGEVYGYAHYKGDRGIICLRNPDVREQVVQVPFDKTVHYRDKEGKAFHGRVIYPYVEDLPRQLVSGKPFQLSVPGHSVVFIELRPGKAARVTPAAIAGSIEGKGEAVLDGNGNGKVTVRVDVPDEAMDRCDLFLISRSDGKQPDFTNITVNGAPATVRSADGTAGPVKKIDETSAITGGSVGGNWTLRSVDLRALRGKSVAVAAEASGSSSPCSIEAWVVADRPVVASALSQEHLPPDDWRNFRRQTVQLLSNKPSVPRVTKGEGHAGQTKK